MSDPVASDDPLALAEYAAGGAAVLTDAERWPTMDAAGAARLHRWRTHPAAPRWVHETGDRVTPDMLDRVRTPLPTQGWLAEHLETARRLLYYRGMPGLHTLADFPPIGRAHLAADIAAFVPLDADLGRILHGTSSGSTGAALRIPDDVEEVARGFHHLVGLVSGAGVHWRPDGERLALVSVVHQRQAFTYVSLVSGFDQRAMARLNLAAHAWEAASDRAAFLRDADPQVITGNPTSLAELLAPDLRGVVRPLALFSGAMALAAPLRADLEAAFGCPVFDVYGLHETRPLAVRTDDGPFRVLDRRVLVEALGPDGRPVAEGEVGEITVTAGENPLLPLVRYRTGDFGRLVPLPGGGVGIADLEGREHTVFVSGEGGRIPCVDLTQQLQAHGAHGWSVEQSADGRVRARIAGGDADAVAEALRALLRQPLEVERVERVADLGDGKPRRYRSAAPAPTPAATPTPAPIPARLLPTGETAT
ncbi:CoF synthetase [Microbacterium sp. dk485]|uniref:CoF synthetase n=1 Tax=Microbacterium wangchenii TaxID=2541726 RepID=A0ABX5SWZ4_9MICO|nr:MULTISPECIES: AMP-binding protein [Microbacterium]QBR89751.1 CoF synthetase [Microbacterium wangchenii]TFV85390.1 CoF synthetase [Microbacterium sp. dk485]TXK16651.1 AMP-binding protein [Microbacterium wangchenii]